MIDRTTPDSFHAVVFPCSYSLFLSLIVLVCVHPAVATSSRVVLVAVFVAHLASRLSSPVLPAFGEALIQVGTDDAFVEFGAANVFHAVQGVLVCVVLDKAEAARCLLEAIEAHDEALDFAAPACWSVQAVDNVRSEW